MLPTQIYDNVKYSYAANVSLSGGGAFLLLSYVLYNFYV